MSTPYIQAAQRYAAGVLNGSIPACKWTRLAVQRQQDDLRRPLSAQWPYVFDEESASRPCEFLEMMPHVKGKWAREGLLIELEDWQCWIVTTVYGWRHCETGMRRYRESYIEVPRKNAKSTLSSGLALYMLCCDDEVGAEVYSAATTRDQARIVFDVSRSMADRSPWMKSSRYIGLVVNKHDLYVDKNGSIYRSLATEGNTQDGLNVHFAVIDELHAHKNRALYDVLDTARGAREQSMLWSITTAGSDLSGICYERRNHLTKVLDGVIDEPALFGVIYSIDAGDDPMSPQSWAKANPNWSVSVLEEDMQAAARKAQAMPSALNNFLTKRLNVWVNGASPWMDMRAWERCGQPGLLPAHAPEGTPIWMGLDLAEKRDFAALAAVFEVDGVWHVCMRLYLNEQAVQESGNAHLSGWARQGHVQVTDGAITDFDQVAQDMRALCQQHNVQEIAFDPALSMYFASKLIEEGLPLVEITQRAMFFTPPLLQVENLVHEGRLRHDGNPVMTWMVSNLVVKVSKFNELRQPTKERSENKIDGAMAMLMALGRALAVPEPEKDNSDSFWESFLKSPEPQ